MNKDTVVIDLDGTLSDGTGRYHLVKGKHRDYEAFHAKLGEDPVNPPIAALMRAMVLTHTVVCVSARPAKYREATIAWLEKNSLARDFHALFLLRQENDNTPDQELKRAWLHAYGKERVLFTVDDRQKVVDMWREEGITCLQCAAWADDKVPALVP